MIWLYCGAKNAVAKIHCFWALHKPHSKQKPSSLVVMECLNKLFFVTEVGFFYFSISDLDEMSSHSTVDRKSGSPKKLLQFKCLK